MKLKMTWMKSISCCGNIYTGKISIYKAEMDQINPLQNMVQFNNKTRQKKEDKGKKYF